jgi:tetratricopeptide (TPR) repeat protein
MFEKIIGWYSDMKEIYGQIVNEITKTMEIPPQSDRFIDIFTMSHTQRLENQSFVINVSADVPCDEYIVVFHCGDQEFFNIDHKSAPVSELTDVEECLQLVNKLTKTQIFLVISGSVIPLEIQSIFGSPQVHALYFFRNNQLQYPINKRKVRGLFDNQEMLSERLYNDILFYREHFNHTSRIDIFSTIERTGNIISQLNNQQIAFLIYNLFINILPQIPFLEFKLEDLTKICDTLFHNQGENIAYYVNQLQKETSEVIAFAQDPRFSQIVSRLLHLDRLNELLILQKPLVDIQKRVLKSVEIFSTDTVYFARIISTDTFEKMKRSTGELISIGTFILATKSLLTPRTIARKTADNGLISILFQIDVVKDTRLLEIDFGRVIFPFGSVFHLESINQALDGVWYIKIYPADLEFRFIKEQLQFEMEIPLTWLTYGNYLHFFKKSDQAKTYFEFLLKTLPVEHVDRPSIYNNLALIYTMENEDDERTKAEKMFDNALQCTQAMKSNSTISEYKDQTYIEIPTANVTLPQTVIDHSTVLASIADVYYRKGDYKLALDHYKQAFELSTDLRCRSYYQKMIETVKKDIEM